MTLTEKTAAIHRLGTDLGFDLVGVAPAGPVARAAYLRDWLDQGRAGCMNYLHHYFEQRTDPRRLLPGARSVIVVGLNHRQPTPPRPRDQPTGRVAMYAWGDDYHGLMRERLDRMVDSMRRTIDEPFGARVCVDTAPILEREWAAAAGIGWIGKSTMLLHERLGSYLFLGEMITTLELAPDEPATDRCGTCRRCLEACPTGALFEPYHLDASRCVSYLTIELRGSIPPEFHEAVGDWVFGCDVCQQVCPYNLKAPMGRTFGIRSPGPFPVLGEMAVWTVEEYRAILRGSAMKRAKLPMLQRNATIARANAGSPSTSY